MIPVPKIEVDRYERTAMKKHSVSVVLATYNGEKYLQEQLESLLCQKGVQVKILVRDDGSTDGTIAILNEYKSKAHCSPLAWKIPWTGGAWWATVHGVAKSQT